jgi:hypothetical protein
MHHVYQRGRKAHLDIIDRGIDQESVTFPGKIMVMRHGRNPGLGDQLGHGYPQGDIHGYGQRIFSDDAINLEGMNKTRKLLPEMGGHGEYELGYLARPRGFPHNALIDFHDIGAFKMRFIDDKAPLRQAVHRSRAVKAEIAVPLKDCGPLFYLMAHAVSAGDASRYESDVFHACILQSGILKIDCAKAAFPSLERRG